ncbi:2-hydroxyacid dehydrogenase [Pseudogracilibacillus sp. SO30301A]|uniref:2-hydroxyacid dehydrogenase n=1 Tax=Pseudogracilibacillus sp. SO30301A TaxID=3098291 RepID=UPI00300E54C9
MRKPTIYITRKIPEYLLEPFKDRLHITMWTSESKPVPKDILYEEAKKADGLLCLITEKINQAFCQYASHLKIIANMAVGYDNIDLESAQKNKIIVTNTPDVLTETTADLTFALLMATARRLIEATNYIYNDQWGEWSPFMLAGSDIHHKTIGIVGMGRIGEAVAKRAKGFNMDILYHNRSRNLEVENELNATYVSFEDLLKESDFVVSLVPLSEATVDMFDKKAFQTMKSSGIFINASRGGVVDEDALFEALDKKIIRAAGLDVFKQEPISSTHPLTKLTNVVLLPHIGSASLATREKMLKLCLENIDLVFQGKQPKTPIY